MIYGNLLSALQAEAIGTAVYILNITLSNTLDRDFPRHVIDIALRRAINNRKLLLNTLRVYGATTIIYNHDVPRGAKFNKRGQRGQLIGYEDSIYRIWIALQHKVVRLLYCQFVEDGELAEILGTEASVSKEFNQQFEYNVVQPRGKLLEVPAGYTIKSVQDDSVYKNDRIGGPNPIAANNALKAVDDTTKLP